MIVSAKPAAVTSGSNHNVYVPSHQMLAPTKINKNFGDDKICSNTSR